MITYQLIFVSKMNSLLLKINHPIYSIEAKFTCYNSNYFKKKLYIYIEKKTKKKRQQLLTTVARNRICINQNAHGHPIDTTK